jgi:hypothetical protein
MSEIKWQDFDVYYNDEPQDGEGRCPQVAMFPHVRPEGIVGGNRQLTHLERIQITFDYPLSQPTTREFFKEGGFTLYDFYQAVYEGYVKIYAEEDGAVGDPGLIPGMLNRATSNGPHGIWGHGIEDLFLEGFRETSPGKFELGMGS